MRLNQLARVTPLIAMLLMALSFSGTAIAQGEDVDSDSSGTPYDEDYPWGQNGTASHPAGYDGKPGDAENTAGAKAGTRKRAQTQMGVRAAKAMVPAKVEMAETALVPGLGAPEATEAHMAMADTAAKAATIRGRAAMEAMAEPPVDLVGTAEQVATKQEPVAPEGMARALVMWAVLAVTAE